MQVILKKYDFFYPDFFRLNTLFCVAIASVKHKLKRGSQFLFPGRTTTKGQFRLQMIILHKGTAASFKTNTFLAR